MYIPIAESLAALQLAAAGSAQTPQLAIEAPATLKTCQPATFTWTPTQGPYHLAVLSSIDPADREAEAAYVHIPRTTAAWIVDVAPGTEVTVVVRDATGAVAHSESRIVEEGSMDCLD